MWSCKVHFLNRQVSPRKAPVYCLLFSCLGGEGLSYGYMVMSDNLNTEFGHLKMDKPKECISDWALQVILKSLSCFSFSINDKDYVAQPSSAGPCFSCRKHWPLNSFERCKQPAWLGVGGGQRKTSKCLVAKIAFSASRVNLLVLQVINIENTKQLYPIFWKQMS